MMFLILFFISRDRSAFLKIFLRLGGITNLLRSWELYTNFTTIPLILDVEL